jgi:hypothetical protein
MLPIPANVKLYVGLVLVAGAGALNALYNVEPTWKWVASVVGVLGFLETYFTVPSSASKRAS